MRAAWSFLREVCAAWRDDGATSMGAAIAGHGAISARHLAAGDKRRARRAHISKQTPAYAAPMMAGPVP